MSFEAKVKKGHRSRTVDDAINEVQKEEMTTITIQVPKDLHLEFKSLTSAKGEKMKDVFIKAMKTYIN